MGWPKPLLTVCGVSVLEHQLQQLQDAGIDSTTLCMPVSSAMVQEAVSAATPTGFSLRQPARTSASPLSQVETVKLATPDDCETVLVIYGDSLLSVDFGVLLRRHRDFVESGSAATILAHRPRDLLQPNADGRTYHGVMAAEDDIVTRFVEKPRIVEVDWAQPLANAAVFALQVDFLRSTRFATAKNFSFDIFEPAVNELPGAVRAVSIGQGYRHDVGSISRLYDLNVQALRGEFAFPIRGREVVPRCYLDEHIQRGDCVLNPPVLVGRNAHVGANVRLGPNTIIGEGAVLEDGVIVSESVILDKTRIGEGAVVSRSFVGQRCNIARNSILPPYTVFGGFCAFGGTEWPT